jgi:glutathione S-transferase
MTLPILYSLQNCPYAMRARLAILLAQQTVELRAIVMQNKPAEFLAMSPKGTVPVLILENDDACNNKSATGKSEGKECVIDESLDVMLWALKLNDPENLLYSKDADALPEMLQLIQQNDQQFIPNLEQYKCARRFHGNDEEHCRLLCVPFILQLEYRLAQHEFLMGSTPSLLDYALLPFVRQFSRVNRQLFLQGPYARLQSWLNHHLQSKLFSKAMHKYPLWLDNHEGCIFGES